MSDQSYSTPYEVIVLRILKASVKKHRIWNSILAMLIRIQSARRIWAGSFFYAKNMQAPPKGPSKLSKLPARICTTKQFSTSQNTCNSYSSILAKMSDHNPGFVEPTGPAPATCKVVSAATVADKLLQEVKSSLQKFDRAPLLVGFLANNDPAARMYANWTEKTCTQKLVVSC